MASFNLLLQTSGSLQPDGDPAHFVSEYRGSIRYTREQDGKEFRVGKVKAYRIHADLAFETGHSILYACDAHSHHMLKVYEALFDPQTDHLKDEICERFDAFHTDVLVIDYILLSPRWRGLKLGLLAARKLIDLTASGCGLVVTWIHPLNAIGDEFAKFPGDWIPPNETKSEQIAARQKLRRYFRRMGFRRVPGTHLDALSLARVTPTLSDLIQPGH